MKCEGRSTKETAGENNPCPGMANLRKQIRWLVAAFIVVTVAVWARLIVLEARADALEETQRNIDGIRNAINLLRLDVQNYLKEPGK